MSTALYPLGMKTPGNTLPQGGYKSWKGTGALSNPVGTASTNIRPLTNKDPGNVFPTGFGLPRPMKHFRKGRVIVSPPITEPIYNGQFPPAAETKLVNYNLNRFNKSSKSASLSGGAGGLGLVSQIIQYPGLNSIFLNPPNEVSNVLTLNNDCKTCQAYGFVAPYYPNNTYFTNNPNPITTSPKLCCNEEKKAKRRVLAPISIIKKNYYTRLQQYRQNRCQTFDQRCFNFVTPEDVVRETKELNNGAVTEAALRVAKPGGPLLTANTYFAQCFPNGEIYEALETSIIMRFAYIMKNNFNGALSAEQLMEINNLTTLGELYSYIKNLPNEQKQSVEKIYIQFITNPYIGIPLSGPSNPLGCKLVVYKPNNSQFARQGAVTSGTRNLKLNVTTIEKNLDSFNYNSRGRRQGLTDQLGTSTTIPFILKNKSSPCLQQTYLMRFQNPKTCFRNQNSNMNKLYDQSMSGPTAPTYFDALYV